MVQIAAFRFEYDQNTEDILSIGIQSFKQLIRKLKSTKSVVKPIAFFYGIVTNKLKELLLNQVTEVSESKPVRYVLETGEVMYYDWLHSEAGQHECLTKPNILKRVLPVNLKTMFCGFM
jgi:hypothetical protein